jgi:hypothetical protein
MAAVRGDLARTVLPDRYRRRINVDLKIFLGLGQKKCWRIATTRIGQKESKLGHDSPDYFCRGAEIHISWVKHVSKNQSRIEISGGKHAARVCLLPAAGATARKRVLIYLN